MNELLSFDAYTCPLSENLALNISKGTIFRLSFFISQSLTIP